MVSSLSYGLVGIAVIMGYFAKKRTATTLVIDRTLSRTYILIIVLFPLTLIPGFVHISWVRYLFGVFFLADFIFYISLMYRKRLIELIEESEELTFAKFVPESLSYQRMALACQVLVAVMLLYFGSRYLVSSVAAVAEKINASPLGLAMIIIPAATAIPETIAALIWGYKGRDTLSIGSPVGEKLLYAPFISEANTNKSY